MDNIDETSVNKFTNFNAWMKKRIESNRAHFLSTVNMDNWPANKYISYQGYLYKPLRIDWPAGSDTGMLYVKPVGFAKKLQSGPSTTIVPINNQQIKIQVSREVNRKKKIK